MFEEASSVLLMRNELFFHRLYLMSHACVLWGREMCHFS